VVKCFLHRFLSKIYNFFVILQALTVLHLGKDWHQLVHQQRKPEAVDIYKSILRLFQDKRTALYSIHQIGV
jgi:hypothetical protein